jgi:heme exporter protein B
MATSSSISAEVPAKTPRDQWWGEMLAVLRKDARSEWRTKSAVSTLLMFALTALVLVSFTTDTLSIGYNVIRSNLLASLYWIIVYFSASAGLPRVFVKEEEMRTASALRLVSSPSAVLGGKLLFNLALLETVTFLMLPLFVLFFRPEIQHWGLLVGHLAVGSAAMAGTATVLGAIVARATNRGYLMVILGFGPLLPVLALSIEGTAGAMHGDNRNQLVALLSYLVVMVIVSGALFEHVWAE